MVALMVVLVLVVVLFLVHGLVATRRPAWRRRRLERLSFRAQLPLLDAEVPRALVERLGRRVAARELAGLWGGLVGAVLVAAAAAAGVWQRPVLDAVPVLPYVVVASCAALGVTVVAAREAVAAPSVEGRRRARSRACRLEDYVPRTSLLSTRVLCALPVLVWALVQWRRAVDGEPLGEPLLATSVVGVLAVVWVVSEVLARRVLAMPQPAGRPLELAWDDVLRARLLHELATVLLYVGSVSLVAVAQLLADLAGTGSAVEPWWLLPTAVVGALLLTGVYGPFRGRPSERYVRARLWRVQPVPGRPGEVDDPALAP